MMGGFGFWLLILVVVFFLFGGCGRRWFRGGGGGCGTGWPGPGPEPQGPLGEPAETPRQILDCRLAKGEITVEEYRRLLQELGEPK